MRGAISSIRKPLFGSVLVPAAPPPERTARTMSCVLLLVSFEPLLPKETPLPARFVSSVVWPIEASRSVGMRTPTLACEVLMLAGRPRLLIGSGGLVDPASTEETVVSRITRVVRNSSTPSPLVSTRSPWLRSITGR